MSEWLHGVRDVGEVQQEIDHPWKQSAAKLVVFGFFPVLYATGPKRFEEHDPWGLKTLVCR